MAPKKYVFTWSKALFSSCSSFPGAWSHWWFRFRSFLLMDLTPAGTRVLCSTSLLFQVFRGLPAVPIFTHLYPSLPAAEERHSAEVLRELPTSWRINWRNDELKDLMNWWKNMKDLAKNAPETISRGWNDAWRSQSLQLCMLLAVWFPAIVEDLEHKDEKHRGI